MTLTKQQIEQLSTLSRRHYSEKNYAAGADCCRKILASHPAYTPAYNNLAVMLKAQGHVGEAIHCYQTALAINDGCADTWYNLANSLHQTNDLTGAAAAFRRALHLRPSFAAAYTNLGLVLEKQGHLAGALECYDQALVINPGCANSFNNMANVFKQQGRLAEALALYDQSLTLCPAQSEAHCNRALTLKDLGKYHEAALSYRQSLALDPENVGANWNYALLQLLLGDLEAGFNRYEWRLKNKETLPWPEYFSEKPQWQGEFFVGKRLLILDEQGNGDSLHFVRYLPQVKSRGGVVLFAGSRPLLRLYKDLPGVDELFESDTKDTLSQIKFDLLVPLMSLPRIFGTTLTTIPASVPYLRPDPLLTEKWRQKFPANTLKIGLVWAGNPIHKNDHNRSCRLVDMAPLNQITGATFYSLQKGEAAIQSASPPAGMHLWDWTGQLGDFAETAALIECLDLVITVDTAVAHLAGSLGRPVWTLLPFVPEWRWLLSRTDSPWYPTMRLFRQTVPGDWPGLFQEVARALQNRLAGNSHPPANDSKKRTHAMNINDTLPIQQQLHILLPQIKNLVAARQFDQAQHDCNLFLALSPDHAEILNWYAYILDQTDQAELAAEKLQRLLPLQPHCATTRDNLHNMWQKTGIRQFNRGELNLALTHFFRLLPHRPNDPKLHGNIAVVYKNLGDLPKALEHFRISLSLAPNDPLVRWNYSRTLLLNGDLETGFPLYECRTHFKHLGVYTDWMLNKPQWQGELFRNKRLMIYNDQGFGDILQALRYIPLVKERGGTVIFSAGRQLLRLLTDYPGIDELVYHSSDTNEKTTADLSVLLMSLPYLFGTTLDTIPAKVPYLSAPVPLVLEWRQRLPQIVSRRKIGLVWSGNTQQTSDLSTFAPLAALSGTTFYSLQKGAAATQAQTPPPGLALIDLTEQIRDFADTAALIANLDLVITVDTSVAHLAGAMGKPVWVLVPHAPCWRWLLHRTDSPWYPSMRLFRQSSPGEWADVISKIFGELAP